MIETTTKIRTGKGGRPKLTIDVKLSAKLQGRVTEAEKLEFLEKAAAAGMTEGELVRTLGRSLVISSQHRGKDPELVEAVRALERELNAIGNNINQIALAANSGRDMPYYWREIGDHLRGVLDKVIERMDD